MRTIVKKGIFFLIGLPFHFLAADLLPEKITYFAENGSSGVYLELIDSKNPTLYINCTLCRFPSTDHPSILIAYTIGSKKQESLAYVHQGGQRLQLPENDQNRIIEALKQSQKISLEFDHFRAWFVPKSKSNL